MCCVDLVVEVGEDGKTNGITPTYLKVSCDVLDLDMKPHVLSTGDPFTQSESFKIWVVRSMPHRSQCDAMSLWKVGYLEGGGSRAAKRRNKGNQDTVLQ